VRRTKKYRPERLDLKENLLALWRGTGPFRTSIVNFRCNFNMSITVGYLQTVQGQRG